MQAVVGRFLIVACFVVLVACLGVGCGDDDDDAVIDAAPADDTAIAFDAREPDASVPDAGVPDAGVPDAAMPDASVPDAGVPDAGVPDASVPDAGVPDASVPDAAPPVAEVYIAAGPFVMGSDSGEGDADERPEHVVTLSAYYIDEYEVTNAQWRACVSAGGCTAPAITNSSTRTGYYTDPTYDDYPVIYVTWTQASEYCAWTGKRLPTEAEWEKAARGGCEIEAPSTCGAEDERTYPWGEAAATCSLANYGGATGCVGDTDAVGARSPAGDSPYGARDIGGNVLEWVADWYASDYYSSAPGTDPTGPASGTFRVARGGAWNFNASGLRVANRMSFAPTILNNYLGVRCARTP